MAMAIVLRFSTCTNLKEKFQNNINWAICVLGKVFLRGEMQILLVPKTSSPYDF
jgi:hypothetical protein